jgi:hypothetical protein
MTESRVTPWYSLTVEFDRTWTSQITAGIQGRRVRGPSEALEVAMLHDATLFRSRSGNQSLLALPRDVFARPGILDRVMALADIREAPAPVGPDRDELLRMVA